MKDPIGPLLLATEHTEFDAGAERIAMALARRHGLPLRVVLPVASNSEIEMLVPHEFLRLEERAARSVQAVREAATGIEVEAHVRLGAEPWREIVAEVRECGAGLLVTRRRGRTGFLANLLVGEMVGKVAGHANCSVLLVPRGAQPWSRRILAAVDDSPSAPAVTAMAQAISQACGLPLDFLTVGEGEGAPHAVILETAARSGADLIVLGRRGRTRLDRPVLGSVAQKVAGLSPGPVLLVQA